MCSSGTLLAHRWLDDTDRVCHVSKQGETHITAIKQRDWQLLHLIAEYRKGGFVNSADRAAQRLQEHVRNSRQVRAGWRGLGLKLSPTAPYRIAADSAAQGLGENPACTTIVSVDGIELACLELHEVQTLVLGPSDSEIALTLRLTGSGGHEPADTETTQMVQAVVKRSSCDTSYTSASQQQQREFKSMTPSQDTASTFCGLQVVMWKRVQAVQETQAVGSRLSECPAEENCQTQLSMAAITPRATMRAVQQWHQQLLDLDAAADAETEERKRAAAGLEASPTRIAHKMSQPRASTAPLSLPAPALFSDSLSALAQAGESPSTRRPSQEQHESSMSFFGWPVAGWNEQDARSRARRPDIPKAHSSARPWVLLGSNLAGSNDHMVDEQTLLLAGICPSALDAPAKPLDVAERARDGPTHVFDRGLHAPQHLGYDNPSNDVSSRAGPLDGGLLHAPQLLSDALSAISKGPHPALLFRPASAVSVAWHCRMLTTRVHCTLSQASPYTLHPKHLG